MEIPEIFELYNSKEKRNYNISYTAAMPCLVEDEYLDQTIKSLFQQEIKDADLLYSIIVVISNLVRVLSSISTSRLSFLFILYLPTSPKLYL